MRLKFINICFIYIQITINTVVMQTQAKFCLSLTKLNTNCFSAAQTLSLTPQVVPSAYTKNLFF